MPMICWPDVPVLALSAPQGMEESRELLLGGDTG
jgi:hypothetical protein